MQCGLAWTVGNLFFSKVVVAVVNLGYKLSLGPNYPQPFFHALTLPCIVVNLLLSALHLAHILSTTCIISIHTVSQIIFSVICILPSHLSFLESPAIYVFAFICKKVACTWETSALHVSFFYIDGRPFVGDVYVLVVFYSCFWCQDDI